MDLRFFCDWACDISASGGSGNAAGVGICSGGVFGGVDVNTVRGGSGGGGGSIDPAISFGVRSAASSNAMMPL
jgi:hypothetical protein